MPRASLHSTQANPLLRCSEEGGRLGASTPPPPPSPKFDTASSSTELSQVRCVTCQLGYQANLCGSRLASSSGVFCASLRVSWQRLAIFPPYVLNSPLILRALQQFHIGCPKKTNRLVWTSPGTRLGRRRGCYVQGDCSRFYRAYGAGVDAAHVRGKGGPG